MQPIKHAYSASALFTALIVLGAYIRIPVPVVPFTLQFLFTNLAGLCLGRRYGFLAVMTYILLGLVGLPVFTGGGGPAYILQPTFGYIIGFALGTGAAGWICSRATPHRTYLTYVKAGMVNLSIVYALGLCWFYGVTRFIMGSAISIDTVLLYGFVFAVPGDLVLCGISTIMALRLDRLGLINRTALSKEASLS